MFGKIINNDTGLCQVGLGTNIQFYKSLGMVELDVEQSEIDGNYYLKSKCPHKTNEVKQQEKEDLINRLTCTALDLVSFIKNIGVEDSVILKFLNDNPNIQLQLTFCKDVYCGVVRQLCPIKITEELVITEDMIVNFFKQKHNIT